MLDRTIPLARLQDCQDERFADTKEHKVAMVMQSLVMAAGELELMSHDAECRRILAEDFGRISAVRLAMEIVYGRVEASILGEAA